MKSRGAFRKLRILALLLVLFFVATNTWLTKLRSTDWNEALWVVIYPINGDGNGQVGNYIDSLTPTTFSEIETFLAQEAQRYGVEIAKPVTIKLAPVQDERPPKPPANGDRLGVMWWSLKMRYWAYDHNNYAGPKPDIQIFVVYHDPKLHRQVDHSLGLQKGLIGVVNAYAHKKDSARNNVVIAHELLHTLGATDKYDMHNTLPVYPLGYADPEQTPLLPQRRAEVMAGRMAITKTTARMPNSLRETIVGPISAREIRWID